MFGQFFILALLARPVCAETIEVALDHFAEESEVIALEYALAAPFDPAKPTVIVIADAQQFYVRADRMERIREQLFGAEFNVVGIVGRGSSPQASATCRDKSETVDWHCAYRIFKAEQWIEDIDAVRRQLVGEQGKILLFGQSGGAFLVHQYLAVHGKYVERAITPAAVNPYLATSLGLNTDHFWNELGQQGQELQQQALLAAQQFNEERADLISILQRQNFFHSAEEIGHARSTLLSKLAQGDRDAFESAKQKYQVDAIKGLFDSDRGISITVRMWEFYAPSRSATLMRQPGIHPDHESTRNAALPIIEASKRREISVPAWNQGNIRQLDTEVLVLSGRFDHTVDYRTSIALAHMYAFAQLIIVRDNHTFDDMKASGAYKKLIRTFLANGLDSNGYRGVIEELQDAIWRE